MGLNAAATAHQVSKVALGRRITGAVELGAVPGSEPVLPVDVEAKFAKFASDMADMGFGLTWEELRRKAKQLAVAMGIEGLTPSNGWLDGFKDGRLELVTQTSQAFAMAWVGAMKYPASINQYMQNVLNATLKKVEEWNGRPVEAAQVYNLDETGSITLGSASK
eukprot:jgi/Mesvir1/5964/Mv00720-RA.1